MVGGCTKTNPCSAVEVVEQALDAARRLDPVLHFLEELDVPGARTAAGAVGADRSTRGRAVSGADPCWVFNVTGHPAVSVPAGLADGLPVGVQVVAPHGSDQIALAVARLLQVALPSPPVC